MNLTISVLLLLIGISIIGYWAIYVSRGKMQQGLRTIESDGYIAFHILAEIFTAFSCIIGGFGLLMSAGWGDLVALYGSGMLLFTSVNGLAWKEVRRRPAMAWLFIPPAIVAILSAVYLIFY